MMHFDGKYSSTFPTFSSLFSSRPAGKDSDTLPTFCSLFYVHVLLVVQ